MRKKLPSFCKKGKQCLVQYNLYTDIRSEQLLPKFRDQQITTSPQPLADPIRTCKHHQCPYLTRL